MINNNHNSSCTFAEDLVSYLYGEIGEKEKAKFVAHLPECGSCAEELSAFGIVRSSVLNWREQDFAPLDTPSFELPATKGLPAGVETVSLSASWLARLREIFSFTPALATTATAFAALVICAGLFYVGAGFLRENVENDISAVNKQSAVFEPVPEPTIETAEITPQKAQSENGQPRKTSGTENFETTKSSKQTVIEKKTAATVSDKKAVPVKTKSQPKSNNAAKPPANSPRTTKRADVQLLSDRGEEDETLRLLDLLEEIGSR